MSVAVLLLNWNTTDNTVKCIESLLAGVARPDEILIIDNSKDKSLIEIIKKFSCVKLIMNDRNYGFTGGNNIGLRILLRGKHDYIWILNNDTIVDKNCLKYLLEEIEKDGDIAAVTGKILYAHPSNKIWYGGATLSYWTLKAKHRGALENDFGQYNVSEDVPFISGCCMLARRSAFDKVGLFDDNFFAYSEDFDWCLRAKREGLRLRYVPKAIVYHYVSSSIHKNKGKVSGGTSSPLQIYLVYRNRAYIIRKHANSLMQRVISIISYLISFHIYLFGLLILLRFDKLRALLLGIKDGLFKQFVYSNESIKTAEKQLELIEKYRLLA